MRYLFAAMVALALLTAPAHGQVSFSNGRQSNAADNSLTTLQKILNTLNGGTASTAYIETSTAWETNHVLKNTACSVMSITGFNNSSSGQYILVFNATSLPADNTVPSITPVFVPAKSNFSIECPISGIPFTNGAVICRSSTANLKTIGGGGADCWFTAVIKP